MGKVVVVGGVAGGATAASQLRRLDPDCEIVIFEKDRDISFANCGLPYHIGGEVAERSQLIAATPESFGKKDVTVRTYHEVIKVNTSENFVTVKNLESGEIFEESYDHLVLSPGGRPRIVPALAGVPENHVLHTLEDMDEIMKYIDEEDIREVVIVGSGFIGMEVTENLRMRDIDVTLVHRNGYLYGHIEEEMAAVLQQTLEDHGVTLKMNSEIDRVADGYAHLTTNEKIPAPMIIQGIGLTPNTEFLRDSGVDVTDRGLIPVNEYGQTNIENVYALGDIMETNYLHAPEIRANIKLAWPAHRMAYTIANHIHGGYDVKFEGLLGTNIMRLFEYEIGAIGLERKDVRDIEHFVIDNQQNFKAGYMEGASKIRTKIYVGNDGTILRAAMISKSGVDKRLDTLAAHIRAGGKAQDLINIEVAYSPPFSSPKSDLNMVGYKAIEEMKKRGLY
ncbi:CoA-disulfide reductase [Salinicoccus kekensis]|uniref:CoA-disulfide reductase n=1 Tax=Salinicoccus kekensis TaxID=714307 RepID=A0A285UTL0_9STAP|nr:CoA-disulfide reductase [Salinicoccus kekensis]SOC45017.1 CoA-disulfide reductase [Salinicoccus kekensis]